MSKPLDTYEIEYIDLSSGYDGKCIAVIKAYSHKQAVFLLCKTHGLHRSRIRIASVRPKVVHPTLFPL